MTTLARRLAEATRAEIALWLYLPAPASKRLGNSLTRFFSGPVFELGLKLRSRTRRLTMDEAKDRGRAYADGVLPRLSSGAAELRLLLHQVAPDYEKPICKKCGPVTHKTRCFWPECPMVNPDARDMMWIEDEKKAAVWPPKEEADV